MFSVLNVRMTKLTLQGHLHKYNGIVHAMLLFALGKYVKALGRNMAAMISLKRCDALV